MQSLFCWEEPGQGGLKCDYIIYHLLVLPDFSLNLLIGIICQCTPKEECDLSIKKAHKMGSSYSVCPDLFSVTFSLSLWILCIQSKLLCPAFISYLWTQEALWMANLGQLDQLYLLLSAKRLHAYEGPPSGCHTGECSIGSCSYTLLIPFFSPFCTL